MKIELQVERLYIPHNFISFPGMSHDINSACTRIIFEIISGITKRIEFCMKTSYLDFMFTNLKIPIPINALNLNVVPVFIL